MDRIRYVYDSHRRETVTLKYSQTPEREYDMLCMFDSPRIICPLELREDCIALPYFPERSADGLAGYCTEKEAWRFLRDVSEGLVHMHGRGFIHKDLTTANVLIGKDGYVICDFDREEDRMSFSFTPPEWDRTEKHMTEKSDIWSLGACTFHLLMGVCIFSGRGGKGQKKDTPVPSLRTDMYSPSLSELVRRCLHYNPAERPSAEEIIETTARQLSEGCFNIHKKIKKDLLPDSSKDSFWPEDMISE